MELLVKKGCFSSKTTFSLHEQWANCNDWGTFQYQAEKESSTFTNKHVLTLFGIGFDINKKGLVLARLYKMSIKMTHFC